MNARNFLLIIALVVAGLFSAQAFAYIPHSSTIASRTARNSGKGVYAIEQEVQFRTAAEPISLRERWIVENGENMRLSVSGTKASAEAVHYEAVYKNLKRTAFNLEGGVATSAQSPEFLESVMHARSGKGLLAALVRAKIIPGGFVKDRPRYATLQQLEKAQEKNKVTTEAGLRLGRSNGVVTWIFGEPTAPEAPKLNASAYIEQDAFLLRRLRFPSEAEVSAERHSNYAGNLKLPRERTVTWGNNSVTIRVLSVKQVPAAQATKLLETGAVAAAKPQSAKLPDLPQVREFYQRFR